ncbi:hypothetical protein [Sphingomonas oryzagri]
MKNHTDPTPDELALYDKISELGSIVWKKSTGLTVGNFEPRMLSMMLYSRLWSNHKGYTILWKEEQALEADIVLRSAIESAICIAANLRLSDDFVLLMRQDAAFTILGQIKIFRANGDSEMVQKGESVLRNLQSKLPSGIKAAKLDWKLLAERGGVDQLYGFHRMLSGVSSHVTGLSILRGVTNDEMEDGHAELDGIARKMHLMMMAAAMLQGALIHAAVIEAEPEVERAHRLVADMNALSMAWPGVEG